jgi:hypothetical protein
MNATEITNFAAAQHAFAGIDELPTTDRDAVAQNVIDYGPAIRRAGVDYRITRDPESGLQFVYADGKKIGQTQTPAGAKLIRRNHARNIERQMV